MTDLTRPVGPIVPDWTPAVLPDALVLQGRWAHMRLLDVTRDVEPLWAQFVGQDWVWDYLSTQPPQDVATFAAMMQTNAERSTQPCYVICDAATDQPMGYACFWTVVAADGNAEIGNVNLSPVLQQTPIATEAFYLMLNWAFSNGYRRMEWKCNALNAPSRRAAARLGFSYEGVFRNHQVSLGRNRDTAWFGMTDGDWQAMKPAFETWLSPNNFDDDGEQRQSLRSLTGPYLVMTDPVLD